jgi:hypothetical protein
VPAGAVVEAHGSGAFRMDGIEAIEQLRTRDSHAIDTDDRDVPAAGSAGLEHLEVAELDSHVDLAMGDPPTLGGARQHVVVVAEDLVRRV